MKNAPYIGNDDWIHKQISIFTHKLGSYMYMFRNIFDHKIILLDTKIMFLHRSEIEIFTIIDFMVAILKNG